MLRNLETVLSNDWGMQVNAQALTTLNFWCGVQMKQAIKEQMAKALPADVEDALADEFEDKLAVENGLKDDVEPIPLGVAADCVYATYLLSTDLARYSETTERTGRTIHPYGWILEKKKVVTPFGRVLADTKFAVEQRLNEVKGKLYGRGLTAEQANGALQLAKKRLVAEATVPMELQIELVNSETNASMQTWDRDRLIEFLEDNLDKLHLDGMALVEEACKRMLDFNKQRLLEGKFVGDDDEIRLFCGQKTRKEDEPQSLASESLDDLLLTL